MGRYELANAAAEDFENIFNFGIDRFGLTQALDYQIGMKRRFGELADQPKLYPAVAQIGDGYRRSVYHSHSIYYRIESERILIIRILGQQDPKISLRDH